MKKITYLLASAAMLAACQSQPSYKINATISAEAPMSADSTIVVLLTDDGTPQGNILDSTYVINKAFSFEGTVDSVQVAYALFRQPGTSQSMGGIKFILENGTLNIAATKYNCALSGTPTNDLFNTYQTQVAEIRQPMIEAYEAIQDTTLSEEERKAKQEAFNKVRAETGSKTAEVTKAFIQANIGNVVGHNLFCNHYNYFTLEEQETLVTALPANLANTQRIQQIKANLEAEKKTAVGQPYTDFTLKTPDGKDLKLSDIVSKNKVTLIDFWASWCGPCRAEMPNVVKAYKDFKGKGFEIVGVSLDEDSEAWKKAIKDLKMTWPQMSDLKGWKCEGAVLYNVRSIPATLLVAQDGTILAKNLRGEELGKKLAEVLK